MTSDFSLTAPTAPEPSQAELTADVLYSEGGNDECYTPAYAVKPLIKYMRDSGFKTVWCPFDKDESQFCQVLQAAGFRVMRSHIDDGVDFFDYEPYTKYDCIVSNPPFTGKREIFERALSFGKPFALLMTVTWLNDSAPAKLWRDIPLELLMFDRRIQYDNQKKITFKSAYFCHDFLPQQLIFEDLQLVDQGTLDM